MVKGILNFNKASFITLSVATIILLSNIITKADNVVNTNKEDEILSNVTNAKWTVMIYFAGDHHRGEDLEYTLNFLKKSVLIF